MDKLKEQQTRAIKEARQLQLIESLSAWRVVKKADVIFNCGGKAFPAHKIVLASSYPFFDDLFNRVTGPEIMVNDMKPEILEVILDFAYSGDVIKIHTEERAKEVLHVSRKMQIKELVHHCCFFLQNFLCAENALELWALAVTYENEDLKTKVMNCLLLNVKNTVQSIQFLQLPFDYLKDFLIFVQSKHMSMDDLLSGTVQWILYDLKTRESLGRTLLACIDSRLISKSRIESLCKNKSIAQLSADVALKLTDMYHEMFQFDFSSTDKQKPQNITGLSSKAKITFFSEYCLEVKHDYQQPPNHKLSCGVQQFDLTTMTWLPPITPCAIQTLLNVSMCQWGNQICVFGGGMSEYRGHYGVYNLARNQVKYFKIGSNPYLQNSTVCYFKKHLYMIGGEDNYTGEKALYSVLCTKPESETWQETKSLLYPRCSPIVLTSEEFIYVIGGTLDGDVIRVECNYSPDKDYNWQEIIIPKNLEKGKYFIFQNLLHVLCSNNGDCIVLSYDQCQQQWLKTKFSLPFPENVTHIFQFPECEEPFVYISTNNDEFLLPTFLWEPMSGKYTKLPSVTGQARLAMVKSSSAYVWTTETGNAN